MGTSPRFMLKTDARAEPTGPYSASELRELAQVGMVTDVSLIAQEGSARWVPAVKVKGLLPASAAPAQPRPSSSGTPRAQAAARTPAQASQSRPASVAEPASVPASAPRSSNGASSTAPRATAVAPQPPKGGFLGRFARLPVLGSLGIAQTAPALVGAGVLLIVLTFGLGLLVGLIPPDLFKSR